MSATSYPQTPHELARFWQEHVEHWRASGQTQVEYCRQRGLSVHRLRWWKNKFERRGQTAGAPGPELIPVQVQQSPGAEARSDSGVRVWLSERVCVEVGVGFDRSTLGAVVEVLGG